MILTLLISRFNNFLTLELDLVTVMRDMTLVFGKLFYLKTNLINFKYAGARPMVCSMKNFTLSRLMKLRIIISRDNMCQKY
jgi:hypothetical protein